ncbi:MAG: M14 family zinc carboxypeptidase [Thermoanaerobaculia bacterium]
MTYLNVGEVETATANLATAYSSLCQLITLPHATFEGRTAHALRLGGGAPGSRDCLMIICGVHAREWGSCEIGIDFAADLLEAYTGHLALAYGGKIFTAAQIQTLLDSLHVIVFPLVNPDGRHYSQTAAAMWRRNRNPASSGGNPSCVGVDINRNYDFLFDFNATFSPASDVGIHTSDNPCNASQVYHGPAAFSEPETRNVKWLLDTNPRTRWFIDVHSYAEDILFNWGDDQNQSTNPAMSFQNAAFNALRGVDGDAAYKEFIPPTDLAVAQQLAFRFRDALQAVRGKTYTAKQAFDLYPTAGASDDYVYARHFVDPGKGKIYGYTIEWGTEFQPPWAEMELIIQDVSAGLIAFCLAAPCGGGVVAVGLDTPALSFHDVPAGVETVRAAVFSVQTCGAVAFNVTSGPSVTSGPGSFGLPLGNGSLPAAPTAAEREVRIWVSFKGTNPGDVTAGTMTIHCPQTGQDFVIPITANTIAQPKVASVLVLDKSGSMDDPSGIPGQRRIDVLHAAAPSYVTLLPDNDGIGVVSFDQDAHPVQPVTTAGALGVGAGRVGATAAITAHATNPAGSTAIGDGVELAHNTLQPLAGYDRKAIVVFTDGEETAAKYIADVAGLINERVFAIGLGTVEQVNPVALNKLVNNTGGYLLMTDALGPNDIFRLAKYFVQILAGVTNAEVVVDPDGSLPPGVEVRVPFDLTEADYASDPVVLSPAPWAFGFELETPAGVRIDHHALGGVLGVQFVDGAQLNAYRLSLPVVAGGAGAHAGRWHVVLGVRDDGWKKYLAWLRQHDRALGSAGLGVPYSVVVQARSNLSMAAYLTQPSYEPGTTLQLRAVLTEIGLPVEGRARVRAEVKRPDGTQAVVTLAETEPGVFEGSTPAPLTGIYPVRFRAAGTTLRGFRFTREQARTGLVWRGGDSDGPRDEPGNLCSCRQWCDALRCLLEDSGVRRWLEDRHLDPQRLEKCLEKTLCGKG